MHRNTLTQTVNFMEMNHIKLATECERLSLPPAALVVALRSLQSFETGKYFPSRPTGYKIDRPVGRGAAICPNG